MEVTALVKYDIFPYYLVFKGQLLHDRSVQVGTRIYKPENVLKTTKPIKYDFHRAIRYNLVREYDEIDARVRKQLLQKYEEDLK